jgi:CRISPR-associated protein Csb2
VSTYLCISIRFADSTFRGRGDEGKPEWPPSPLRVFQALVAACAARFGNPNLFRDHGVPAFAWFGGLRPPVVIAPAGVTGTPFRAAVPNNDMDVVAADWAKRVEPRKQPTQLKTLKTVRPTHMRDAEEFPAVHYLWEVPDAEQAACERHKEAIFAAARSVVALGWGVDMAVGHGQMLDDAGVRDLKGERWNPVAAGGSTRLRVPTAGTFDALVSRHRDFLGRLVADGFRPVPPLTAFKVVGYRRETDPAERPWAVFRIASVDPDDANPSFDTPRRCRDVAAWVRHTVGEVCATDWPFPEPVAAFVHGHDDTGKQLKGEKADQRFMYLPLPSLEKRGERGEHVGAIRRVLVAAPQGCEDRVAWLRQRLSGQELVWDGRVMGMLTELRPDWVLGRYTGESRVWSTVTPVVWPGHDDGDAGKAERVLRKAFVDAGLSEQLVDGIVELDWRPVGFRAGVDLASRYERPEKLTGRQYHVRVRFAHPVRGPLAVGAGRYRGLGLFAAEGI